MAEPTAISIYFMRNNSLVRIHYFIKAILFLSCTSSFSWIPGVRFNLKDQLISAIFAEVCNFTSFREQKC